MMGRGVRKVKIPVVRNSLRTVVNCWAVCSISDGEAIDKPTLYRCLVIPSPQCRCSMALAALPLPAVWMYSSCEAPTKGFLWKNRLPIVLGQDRYTMYIIQIAPYPQRVAASFYFKIKP